MAKLTELEQKRLDAQKALPDVRSLLKRHGFEVVNYVWQKIVVKEREVSKARQEAESAKRRADDLEKQLKEEL